MAIYLEMFHHYADRFVTGTDFVSSFGPKEQYPGTKPGNGCVKDKKNHARQVTDTSSFTMFLNDEAFQKIVLGANYFRINRLQHTFTPPPVCGDSVSIHIHLIPVCNLKFSVFDSYLACLFQVKANGGWH